MIRNTKVGDILYAVRDNKIAQVEVVYIVPPKYLKQYIHAWIRSYSGVLSIEKYIAFSNLYRTEEKAKEAVLKQCFIE